VRTLTTLQRKALDAKSVGKIYLAEMTLANSGPTLFHATETVKIGSQDYESCLAGPPTGLAERLGQGSNPEVVIPFLNGRWSTYNFLSDAAADYPFVSAAITAKEVWKLNDGTLSDAYTAFVGRVDKRRNVTTERFEVVCSDIRLYYAKQWAQSRLTDSTADPDDKNKIIPIVYGVNVPVPALTKIAGGLSTLKTAITAVSPGNGGTFELSLGDTDPDFPAAGAFTVVLEKEEIRCSSRSGKVFTVATSGRGYNSTVAAAHVAGCTVWEKRTDYTELCCDHSVGALGDTYIDLPDGRVRVTTGVTKNLSTAGGANVVLASKFTVDKAVNLTAADAGHLHDTANTGSPIIATSDSENGAVNVTLTGTRSNIHDQSDVTSYRATSTSPGNTNSAINVVATFPAYTGPAIVKVYAVVTHDSSTSHAVDASNFIKCNGNALDTSSTKCTQKIDLGSSYPAGGNVTFAAAAQMGYSFNSYIYEISLEVITASTASAAADVSLSGNSAADVAIGGRVIQEVSGYKDDGSGTISGTPNLQLENPAHIIRHLVQVRLAVPAGNINATAFSAAATALASACTGGYKFAFAILDEIKPAEIIAFIEDLAAQSRCRIRWNPLVSLEFIPDTAPTEDATIDEADCLDGPVFDEASVMTVENSLTGLYKQNYAPQKSEAAWLGTVTSVDSGGGSSQAIYGIMPTKHEYPAIRDANTAQDRLDHQRDRFKMPRCPVYLKTPWENQNIEVGDAIKLTSSLAEHNNQKFEVIELALTEN